MKQNDSKYHHLYLMVNDNKFYAWEGKEEILKLIKDIYEDHQEIIKEKDDDGKYGIRFKTIHDDSSYSDTHEQFFMTKQRRDNVYDDWINGRHWDSILDTELDYRTPSPNVHDIVKVFKEGESKVYEEQD